MSNSQMVWHPASQNLSPEQLEALSVPARKNPGQGLFRVLMEKKLHALIQANPGDARQAMEMSQDQAPELYLIAQNSLMDQWPQALTHSDLMERVLNLIEWDRPGTLAPENEPTLREVLEAIA
jgi:hypothetical protein